MINMQEFVDIQLGKYDKPSSSTPVSFRCSDELIAKLDALASVLGFATRSKLLTNLVPVAVDEAVYNLPSHLQQLFEQEEADNLYTLKQIEKAEGK